MKDQPWFKNCVVRLKAASDIWAPEGLLSTLQAVEAQMGRIRGEVVGGPRVIDLDLLMVRSISRAASKSTTAPASTGRTTRMRSGALPR